SYTFTEEEATQNAKDLAEKVSEKSRLEDRKKSVGSEFKSKIDAVAAEINVLARKVTSGEEMREFRCRVELDVPNKKRFYIDLNSGQILKTEPFKVEDYQSTLNFDDETPVDELEEKFADKGEPIPEETERAIGEESHPAFPDGDDETESGLPDDDDATELQE
ncbi:MAG: hypothetical protein NUV58_01425, partial [Candidatus Roizmanbacteria bacterium]|nr:hypothetical protein [Candidatus Roizmanbacteria bacterium]